VYEIRDFRDAFNHLRLGWAQLWRGLLNGRFFWKLLDPMAGSI
jgi:hypothetical protein